MKRKLIALGLTLALIIVSVISGTLAYLTDTDQATNVFTVGNVSIDFDEEVGVYDDGDTNFEHDLGKYFRDENGGCVYKGIVPTNVIKKDATVTNKGNAAAYVRVLVVMNNKDAIEKALKKAAVADVFMGWGADYAAGYTVKETPDVVELVSPTNPATYTLGAGETAWVYYLKMAPGAVANVFEGLKSPITFDNEENKMFDNLKIEIYADAIQVEGFTDDDGNPDPTAAFNALETAHPLNDIRTSAPATEYTVSNVEDLKIALANGGNIVVTGTIDPDTNIPVSETKSAELIFDSANGLKSVSGGNYTLLNGANYGIDIYAEDGDISISDASVTTNSNWSIRGKVDGGNSITVSDVEVQANSGAGIYLYGNGSSVIENCTVNHLNLDPAYAATTPWAATAVATSNGMDMTINGGTYVGSNYGVYIYSSGGDLTINDGTFKAQNVIAADADGAGVVTNVTINGGNFDGAIQSLNVMNGGVANIVINGGNFTNYTNAAGTRLTIKGGTFDKDPSERVADGYEVIDNVDGTYTVARKTTSTSITAPAGNTPDENGALISVALTSAPADTLVEIDLGEGEYKMPSTTESKEIVIKGTKDTVIDNTLGSYLDSSKVSFEGVTIKGSTGYANGNGSDYAALYTPNVTYTNCTFDGPFRIGRDGAKFINCTFTNLGNDYVWTYGNDATFEGCTFESAGKALLIYSDAKETTEVSEVIVKDCIFNATTGAKAGAIANQSCAAIEIHNYGHGVKLTASGNTIDSDFSGEWRIKDYVTGRPSVIVNGTEYTSLALDGKTMTIDADKNVTVNG